MDADEAVRMQETERQVTAAIQKALAGDPGPDARTQGERDFATLAEKGAGAVAERYAKLSTSAAGGDVVDGRRLEGFEDAAVEKGGDYAKAVKFGVSDVPVATPDKRMYVKLAPEGGRVVGGAWEPNKRPFVGKPGKEFSEEDLIGEGEKDELRAEYDALVGDDDSEAREAYVESVMEKRKKESKNAAKP